MGYLERILEPGESVRYIGRLHWLIYLPALSIFLLGALLLIASAFYLHYASYLLIVGIICLVISAFTFLPEWLHRMTTEIAITDRRVILKTGILRTRSIEMNMDKVESIDVDQSVFGRIFNFGTVLIRGTGASLEPLDKIENPLKLRSQITAR